MSSRRALPVASLAVYGGMAAIAILVAVVQDRSPLGLPAANDPWFALPAGVGHGLSIAGGLLVAFLTVRATRLLVRRWSLARLLHSSLQPTILDADGTTLLVLGIASGVGEELFFRGLLTPALGLVVSSLAFGFLHQVKGRARWVWATWAGLMGLLFGALYLATGSLVGPILAHAAINVTNLKFLRDTDVEPPKKRRLGGLLQRI
jgi:uncharacterized protein